MDDTFLYDENENIDKDYINENNIIHRQPNIVECEDNRQGIYSIEKLLKKDVVRENILLSNIDINDNYKSHGSKTMIFDLSLNNTGGLSYRKNVIGFRLNECIFTSPIFNITATGGNNTIKYTLLADPITITTPEGYYNIYTLINDINPLSTSSFNLTFEPTTNLITINTTTSITFDRTLLLHNLGFHTYVIDKFTIDSAKPAETHPSINIGTYLDIVVDEIPYNACKHNPRGLNIIHRLPLRTDGDSSIVYYKSNFLDYRYQYLFSPLNLQQLTVHLYLDNKELPLDNLTISFEFELTLLNK